MARLVVNKGHQKGMCNNMRLGYVPKKLFFCFLSLIANTVGRVYVIT